MSNFYGMERKSIESVATSLHASTCREQQQKNYQDKEIDKKSTDTSSGDAKLKKTENFNQFIKPKCAHMLCHRTIIVRNIPFKVTKSQLWNHFAKFGKIHCVKFLYNRKGKNYFGEAEIQYIKVFSALRAASSPKDKHFYSGRYMNPGIICYKKLKNIRKCSRKLNDEDESATRCYFDILPNELINYIFSFLDYNQRIRVERVCKRWQYVSTEILWLNMRTLDLWDTPKKSTKRIFSNQILCSILKRCGSTVREINFQHVRRYGLTHNFPTEIPKYCPNLVAANLNRTTIRVDAVKDFVEGCKNLQTLRFSHCVGFIEESLSWVLQNGKNIKFLDISYNSDVTGESFCFVNDCLEVLVLNGCADLTSSGFIQLKNTRIKHLSFTGSSLLTVKAVLTVIKSLKPTLTGLQMPDFLFKGDKINVRRFLDIFRNLENLRYLNLQNNDYVNGQTLDVIATTCLQLRCLDLSGNYLSDDHLLSLRGLPNLQCLKLNTMIISDRILTELSLSGLSDKLAHVEVQGCPSVGDIGCSALIKNCSGLRYLDVSNCKKVTASIVRERMALKIPDNTRLTIIAGGSGITNFVKNETVFVSSVNLCPIDYKYILDCIRDRM